MDWLDRISIWAIVLLILGSSALINHHSSAASLEKKSPENPVVAKADMRAIEVRVGVIKNLIEAGSMDKAEELAKALLSEYPYIGEPHMLMGDIRMRMQDPVGAILEYRDAVDMNPDYLDKKTPLFQGKKMKSVVGEAIETVNRKIDMEPGNEELRQQRKDIYYMMRRIAGSCG